MYESWWQIWGRGPSLLINETDQQLTCEQDKFKRVTNQCTYNHKDVLGVVFALTCGVLVRCAYCGSAFWVTALAAFLAYWIIQNPLVCVYGPSAVLTAFLRTEEVLDADTHFPSHLLFTAADIRREVSDFVNVHTLVSTASTFDGENAYIGRGGTGENMWRLHLVMVLNTFCNNAAVHFPCLKRALEACPNVISCAISVLQPGVKIPMHVGYYKGILRYMVAVTVPKDRTRAWLNVNGVHINWEEGKGFLWDDMYPHAAYNTTSETRVVLYFDVLRSAGLPSWLSILNRHLMTLVKLTGIANKEIKKTEQVVTHVQ